MREFIDAFDFGGIKRRTIIWGTILAILILTVATAFLSPWKVLAVIVGVVFIFVSFVKPEYCVLFLAFYFPLEPFLLKFVPDEVYVYVRYFSEGLIYILLLSVGFRLLSRSKKIISTPIDLPLFLFIIVAVASLIINLVEPMTGFLGLRQILRFIVLFYVIVYLNLPKGYIKKIILIILAIFVLQGILGIGQAIIGAPADEFLLPSERRSIGGVQLTTGTIQFWESGQRIFATMGRYDQLGTFLCFFMLILAAILYESKSVDKKIYWMIFLLGIPALILTYSRASWFGFILGIFLISVIFKRDKKVLIVFLLILSFIVSYLAYSGIVVRYLIDVPRQTVMERFFEAFSYERWRGEYYGLGRLYFVINTPTVVIKNSPLFGVGPGQYGGGAAAALHNTTAYNKLGLPFGVFGTEGFIDNNWMSLLGETGILGLSLYIWMFVALFIYSMRVFRKSEDSGTRALALGFMGCILAVAFQSFLGTYLEVRTLAFYFWLFAAFIVTLGYREKIA